MIIHPSSLSTRSAYIAILNQSLQSHKWIQKPKTTTPKLSSSKGNGSTVPTLASTPRPFASLTASVEGSTPETRNPDSIKCLRRVPLPQPISRIYLSIYFLLKSITSLSSRFCTTLSPATGFLFLRQY